MSIIHKDATGWLLDHEDAINNDHATSLLPKLKCKDGLFEIGHPFMMDSQFKKLQCQTSAPSKKNGRKRKHAANFGETALIESYEKIKVLLSNALKQLVEIGQAKGYFMRELPKYENNNKAARETAAEAKGCGDGMKQLVAMATTTEEENTKLPIFISGDERIPDVINRMVHYRGNECIRVKLLGSTYIMPPQTSFLLSDISYMEPLLEGKKYDLIVMDPPWQNKSVKRKKTYNTLRTEELIDLPINALAKDGTLLVVWVTNRAQHQQIVTESLFPAWNVRQVVKWYWLKVTKSGVPVYDLDSNHRKPYESLLIGRVGMSDESNDELFKEIPNDKVIISVPCSIHSRKPPLSEILKDFISEDAYCLELFARNLRPHWTSWGNEVLSFQHEDFFSKIPEQT